MANAVSGSSKAPRFEGTFEVYQVEVELYLEEREAWDVVTGAMVRDPNDANQRVDFDNKNRLAKATILRGLRGCQDDEADKVCRMATAKEMWDTIVADKTKRDFSYVSLLKGQLYTTRHVKGQPMAEYLAVMNRIRQQLRSMGTVVADAEMLSALTTGVQLSHPELVEQFDLPTRQGHPPTLQDFSNALLSKDERLRMAEAMGGAMDGNEVPQAVMSATSTNAKGTKKGKVTWKKWKCYHCGKQGHLKRDCWHYLNKQKKATEEGKEEVGKIGKAKKKKKDNKTKDRPGVQNNMLVLNPNAPEIKRPFADSSSDEEDEDGDFPMCGMATRQNASSTNSWMLDCGSSTHVCADKDLFSSLKKSTAMFKVWTGGVTKGCFSGTVMLNVNSQGKNMNVKLNDVEFSPAGDVNLVSLGRMEDEGWIPSFSPAGHEPRKCWLDSKQGRLEFVKSGVHYWMKTCGLLPEGNMAMATLDSDASELMRWHERLGHLNVSAIKSMVDQKVVDGMEISGEQFKRKFKCVTCLSAKARRMSYKKSAVDKRTKINYERLMSDTCDMGKFLPGIGEYRYFQLIQDEGSRFKWCFPIRHKSDSNENTISLIKKLTAQGHRVKTFSSDGGGEFVNTKLKDFLDVHGISFVPTHAYTPEENALVEKLNGVLANKTRTVMMAADMPTMLWPEVLQYVVDIDNMSATRALKGKTPSEKLFGKKPNIGKVKVCGSIGFVYMSKRPHKLSPKAVPAMLLGFSKQAPGYRLLNLRTGRIVEARDVKFREDITVGRKYLENLLKNRQTTCEHIPYVPLPVEFVATEAVHDSAIQRIKDGLPAAIRSTEPSAGSNGLDTSDDSSSSDSEDDQDGAAAGQVQAQAQAPAQAQAQPAVQAVPNGLPAVPVQAQVQGRRRRGHRANHPVQPVRRSRRDRRPNVRMNGYQLMVNDDVEDPSSIEEALHSPQWKQWEEAIKKEFASLQRNGTWKLVERPNDSHGEPVKVLTTKWVLRVKKNERGEVQRYKAILVVHGYKQRFGKEFWKTYSPVVRWATMLIILVIALILALEVDQVDFDTAFLNSGMDGATIYIEQPKQFDDGTGRVCLLLKGIYGLKQAARLWYLTLHEHLEKKMEFKRSYYDVGLYYKWISGRLVLMTIYVDDVMIIGHSEDIKWVKVGLQSQFAIKDLGRVHYLLGMEVNYLPGKSLCLSQTAYIDKVLSRFQMENAKSVRSPQMQNEKVTPIEKDPSKVNDEKIKYQELIGALQYLVTCTRPDIANAVRNLSIYTGSYTKDNYTTAKRVLRYLQGTRTYGLVYKCKDSDEDEGFQVSAYSDADHANCPDTSRSVSGFVLQLNGHTVGFKSKMQSSVTDDTCKSELVAASMCAEDLLWARKMLKELGFKKKTGKLYLDNQSTIKVCTDAGNFDGVKRFAKKSRKLAELVDKDKLEIEYVSTEENVADMFTKALGPQRFEKLRRLLGVADVEGVVERQGSAEVHRKRLTRGKAGQNVGRRSACTEADGRNCWGGNSA